MPCLFLYNVVLKLKLHSTQENMARGQENILNHYQLKKLLINGRNKIFSYSTWGKYTFFSHTCSKMASVRSPFKVKIGWPTTNIKMSPYLPKLSSVKQGGSPLHTTLQILHKPLLCVIISRKGVCYLYTLTQGCENIPVTTDLIH